MTIEWRPTLDSNMLVYAVDGGAGEKHNLANKIVWLAREKRCVLTTQALSEFYKVVTTKGKLDHDTARSLVRRWLNTFEIASANKETVLMAIDAVKRHKISFWDAMLWATARQSRCTVIISEDMNNGQIIEGVRIVNPFITDIFVHLAPHLDV